MADVPKSLNDGQVSDTSESVVFTVSPGTTVDIHQIIMSNVDSSDHIVNLYFKFRKPNNLWGDPRNMAPGRDLASGDVFDYMDGSKLQLESSDQILMDADAPSVVDFMITGVVHEDN